MAERQPLTIGELRLILDAHPADLPVMAEVTTSSMDLATAARRHAQRVGVPVTHAELDRLQQANGSAWVIGAERFDQDQAGGGDGLLLLTE